MKFAIVSPVPYPLPPSPLPLIKRYGRPKIIALCCSTSIIRSAAARHYGKRMVCCLVTVTAAAVMVSMRSETADNDERARDRNRKKLHIVSTRWPNCRESKQREIAFYSIETVFSQPATTATIPAFTCSSAGHSLTQSLILESSLSLSL